MAAGGEWQRQLQGWQGGRNKERDKSRHHQIKVALVRWGDCSERQHKEATIAQVLENLSQFLFSNFGLPPDKVCEKKRLLS